MLLRGWSVRPTADIEPQQPKNSNATSDHRSAVLDRAVVSTALVTEPENSRNRA
jgi:hypothetical protein